MTNIPIRAALLASMSMVVLAATQGCSTDDRATGVTVAVDRIADEYVVEYFQKFPQSATSEGVENADHHRLEDTSPKAYSAWHLVEDALLLRLEELDTSALDGTPQYITYQFLKSRLKQSIGRRVCRMELWNVSPTYTGWQARIAFLASIQPVGDDPERADALNRFGSLPDYLNQEIANLREGLSTGYAAPTNNVRAVIEQMNALVETPIEQSPFMQLSTEGPEEFVSAVRRMVEDQIRPALKKYRDFLVDEYLDQARTTVGVKANPDGEACYKASVAYYATYDVPAAEIHAVGLEQMRLIENEMREIGERSFGVSSPAELMLLVRRSPYLFSSRQEILDYVQAAVDRSGDAVPEWFGIVPEAEVIVEPYPEWQEKNAPGAEYQSPSDDGTRPGIYRVNTYQPETISKAGIESTAFHEAYPGHHLQIAIAKERDDLHDVQRYFGPSGFSEGWALYAERLSDEMGVFSDDIDRVGLLSNEALRAARLVVDSGMHALGWTRPQAVEYLITHTAENPARAEAEIDRYIAVPGQATSYMLGNLEIRRLRQMAEDRLGENFDIKSFHDRVLENGALPLSLLRQKIQSWVDNESAA
ncbi:MAG: DUF885 domain-containing protein [Rhodothermia bacterium]|nr:DUF885 domain-containing protein [Rhodothermia bacterium]